MLWSNKRGTKTDHNVSELAEAVSQEVLVDSLVQVAYEQSPGRFVVELVQAVSGPHLTAVQLCPFYHTNTGIFTAQQ